MTLIWIKLWKIKKTQAKENTTFGNFKGVYMFKVIEKAIKQMKKLQNLRIMKHDKIDMGHRKHQGEDEEMTTIENNPNKKKMKLIWKNDNVVFLNTFYFKLSCDEWFDV